MRHTEKTAGNEFQFGDTCTVQFACVCVRLRRLTGEGFYGYDVIPLVSSV